LLFQLGLEVAARIQVGGQIQMQWPMEPNTLLWYPMINRRQLQLPAVFSWQIEPFGGAMGNAHTQRFFDGNLEFGAL